jgi:transcriptional regulator with XRE-family HTH domain
MRTPGSRDAGAIVRITRQARGLTLAQLGGLTGYSASQVSRYERGITPLIDTTVLRRFADALALPAQTFGLLPDGADRAVRHEIPIKPNVVTGRVCAPSVANEPQWEDGEDPVRRRELLAGAAGLAAGGAFGLPGAARASRLDPAGGLEAVLYGRGSGAVRPASLTVLRGATERARGLFQAARYTQLSAELPELIASVSAARERADAGARVSADALLAEAYIVASGFMVKLNDDQLAWATADRAAQAADAAGDPLLLADARRGVATVLRRTGRADRARTLLVDAADAIRPGRRVTAEQLSVYGNLLQVAAYTAAVDGDRGEARDLIDAAGAAAARLGHDANHRHTAFGPANVALYQVSIAQVLGDNGTAIAHARSLNTASIPTAERRGRYWIDVARAWHQWGRHEQCYQALCAAERAAPAEVRYRPPVRRMTEDLLRTDRRGALHGLRAFAARIGVPR